MVEHIFIWNGILIFYCCHAAVITCIINAKIDWYLNNTTQKTKENTPTWSLTRNHSQSCFITKPSEKQSQNKHTYTQINDLTSRQFSIYGERSLQMDQRRRRTRSKFVVQATVVHWQGEDRRMKERKMLAIYFEGQTIQLMDVGN